MQALHTSMTSGPPGLVRSGNQVALVDKNLNCL